jgi:hypothetical protein
LQKYGAEFSDVRRFELIVPEEMSLTWVTKLVRHALRDAGIDLEPGKPIALE